MRAPGAFMLPNRSPKEGFGKYFGLDIHKQYTVCTHVDRAGILLGQGRIDTDLGSLDDAQPSRDQGQSGPRGRWYLADLCRRAGDSSAEVILAHPLGTRAIAAARVKTDRNDSAISPTCSARI
jgi:hypothetical protein